MLRPLQAAHLTDADANELYNILDDALTSVAGIMSDVRGYEALADIFTGLDQMYDEIKDLHSVYERLAADEDEAELAAMNREYERSVL